MGELMKLGKQIVLGCAGLLFLGGCVHSTKETTTVAPVTGRPTGLFVTITNTAPGTIYTVKYYSIARGDTLSKIARRFGKSVTELTRLNPGITPERLPIGQVIRVAEEKSR